MISGGGTSVVVIKNGRMVHAADGRGVAPLIALYTNDPGKLEGALVVDKVIGKAAALILSLGGASEVYGAVMSKAGRDSLVRFGIGASWGQLVDMITNRAGNGMCPIEQSVTGIDDPAEGLDSIKRRIGEMATGAGLLNIG